MHTQIHIGKPIDATFFERSVDEAACDLVGCWLFTESDSGLVGGRIVETEAYCQNDPTAHCYDKRLPGSPNERSKMCAAMFGHPGSIYIYPQSENWCHLNLVAREPARTAKFGSAVLIRAIEPTHNIECMRTRRSKYRSIPKDGDLCSGPIKLCQALSISHDLFDKELLSDTPLRLHHRNPTDAVLVYRDRRIGVPNDWPRRYLNPASKFLSKNGIASVECTPEWIASVGGLINASDMRAFLGRTPAFEEETACHRTEPTACLSARVGAPAELAIQARRSSANTSLL